MNIIEDIRDALLHAVENRSPPPRTPMDLWTVLKDEWCELPPRYLQTSVEFMPHRVAALLRVPLLNLGISRLRISSTGTPTFNLGLSKGAPDSSKMLKSSTGYDVPC
ncbi:hypothetical protein AVEN_250308-1 [Araneus ventricosus]|uniref:Uncharacterized protein n=1 Tax=Araneus ventricosus TaxID=182803 RepID=A0A4Y2FMX5_ARAVE|nr:hypothetical protein AVEN_250308-1 [Araneus ventricosus]